MLIVDLRETPFRNATLDNALGKIRQGYQHGLTAVGNTCYAYVGAALARLQPAEATIRFWGLASGLIVHADAVLADGTVISTMPPERYAKAGYELVQTRPWSALRTAMTESRGLKFYHGSKRQFPIGFVLSPQKDGSVHGVNGDKFDLPIRRMERVLERYRPAHMISRLESVFLTDDPSRIEHAGGHADHVYQVQPHGGVERACLWWYAQIENHFLNGGRRLAPALAEEWALNYWNAVPPPAGKPATYEYRCRSAVILKELRSVGPWRLPPIET